jgi:hypothetical protein
MWECEDRTSRASAGLTGKLMSMEDVVAMIDARNPPKKRGLHKKAA